MKGEEEQLEKHILSFDILDALDPNIPMGELDGQCDSKKEEIQNTDKKTKAIYLKSKKNYDSALGDYLRSIADFPSLSAEEEQELFKKIKQGDKAAREKVINCNLKWVVKIANRYVDFNNNDRLDIISEGNIGLIEAVDRFDADRGVRFLTYGTWYIRNKITSAFSFNGMFRVPHKAWQKRKALLDKLEAIIGSEYPTEDIRTVLSRKSVEEVAELLEVSPRDVRFYIYGPITQDLDSLSSLQRNGKNGGTADISPYIEDIRDTTDELEDVDTALYMSAFRTIIRDTMMKNLTQMERRIIELSFGLVDGTPHSFTDIAQEFNYTKETIRNIYYKALKRIQTLRNSNKRIQKLLDLN